MTDYSSYDFLLFERKPNGVLLITINRPERLNATNAKLHNQLSRVWLDIADDEETRVVVITGAGRAFSAGGDLDLIDSYNKDVNVIAGVMKEAADIVYNIINLDKPVISAINGVAVGAGLAVALMADISIISETARLTDGHLRIGVGAGDHAMIIWPLLCGIAKAKWGGGPLFAKNQGFEAAVRPRYRIPGAGSRRQSPPPAPALLWPHRPFRPSSRPRLRQKPPPAPCAPLRPRSQGSNVPLVLSGNAPCVGHHRPRSLPLGLAQGFCFVLARSSPNRTP